MAQLRRIDQVAVVGQTQGSFYIIEHQGLRVFPGTAAGRGIPHMAHADIALQTLQRLRRKYLVAKAHPLMGRYLPLGSFCVAHRYTAAFLSPVLQGKKPVVYGPGHIVPIKIIHPENPALLTQFIRPNIKIHQVLIHEVMSFLCVRLPVSYRAVLITTRC